MAYPGNPYEYLKAIRAAGYATAPDYVDKVWSITRSFITYIRDNDLYPPSSSVTPDRKPSDTAAGDADSGSSTTTVSCNASSSSSSVVAGKVGGAPEGGEKGRRDFGWLCSTDAKVCKDGDFGPFPSFASGGRYQCYWYALVRLWVIHDHDVSNWGTAVAGQIPGRLASDPEYTVDSTPHPGDGVAQYEGALGGDDKSGHVAVVEEVKKDADGWRIRISEGNYGTDGSGPWNGYNTRWLAQAQFKGAGSVFFRKNSWKN
ncbi:CHAP domain-containing protein [Bifidobacterium sp. SO1]|nr:CHAP domain-containing protein [Bifidobacterium sp. SO1]